MSARRGIALLMALICLCLVMVLVAAAVTSMDLTRGTIIADRTDASLWSMMQDGEHLAVTWLDANAAGAVTSPDTTDAGIAIIDDAWNTDQGNGRMRVVLHDGLSGVPAHLAYAGSPIRLALPGQLSAIRMPRIDAPMQGQPVDVLECLELPAGTTLFPVPSWSAAPVLWRGGNASSIADLTEDLSREVPGECPVAIVLSPHSDGRININTAPEGVLRAAYTMLGRGGVEELLTARRALMVSELPRHEEETAGTGVSLVTTSDCWNAHITVSWSGRTRSWWTVLASNQKGFSRVQRHAVSP